VTDSEGNVYGPVGRTHGDSVQFEAKAPTPWSYLAYFSGKSGNCLDSLAFHWNNA